MKRSASEAAMIDAAATLAAVAGAKPPDPERVAEFGGRMSRYLRRRRAVRATPTALNRLPPSLISANATIPEMLAEYERLREDLADNAFCPTGPGGGVDPTCSPGGGGHDLAPIQPQLDTIKKAFKKYADDLEGISLVGSWANPTKTPDVGKVSDIDIVIHPKDKNGARSRAYDLRDELRPIFKGQAREVGFDVGPVAEGFLKKKGGGFRTIVGKSLVESENLDTRTVINAFCPTGKGGGIDPTCSPGGKPVADVPYAGGPVHSLPVYRGGPTHEGKNVTYHSTSKAFAESYVNMYNDRFGGGGQLNKSEITIANPAPREVVFSEARKVGIDPEEYTPASVFDSNLSSDDKVARLASKLKSKGYDGAVLEDIPYGEGEPGHAYITFTGAKTTTPPQPAPKPMTKPEAKGTPQQHKQLKSLRKDLAEIEEAARRGYGHDTQAPARYRERIDSLLKEMADNAFCPTGKGGGVDPTCGRESKGRSGLGTFRDRGHAREQFLATSRKTFKEGEIGDDRVTIHLPGNRFVDVTLKEKWEGGGTKFDARIDFGVRGRRDTSVGDTLESESIGMLRRVREAVRSYRDAGFRIEVAPADERRRELYKKFLSKMGLDMVKEGETEVWNSFCPTGKGGGVDPTCSPGGKPGPKTKIRTQHRLRQILAGKGKGNKTKPPTPKVTPTPKPTEPKPAVTVDYDQRDPHHPEAVRVRDDREGRRRLESFLAKTSGMGKEADRLTEYRNRAWDLGNEHHAATQEWLKLAKSRSKAKGHSSKLDAAKKKMDRLRADHEEAIRIRNVAQAEAATLPERGRAILLETHGVPAPSVVQYNSKGEKTYDWEAEGLEPTGDARVAIDEGLGFASRLTGGGRQSAVEMSLSKDGRAHYVADTPDKGVIAMGRTTKTLADLDAEGSGRESYPGQRKVLMKDTAETAVHEVGHHYENTIPGLQDKAKAFLEYRLQGEPVIQMNRKPGMSSLRDDEHGAKDRFDKAFSESEAYYIGKQYHRDTEVVSMGLQKLYQDPVGFARKDPEYFQWLTTSLRGEGTAGGGG